MKNARKKEIHGNEVKYNEKLNHKSFGIVIE